MKTVQTLFVAAALSLSTLPARAELDKKQASALSRTSSQLGMVRGQLQKTLEKYTLTQRNVDEHTKRVERLDAMVALILFSRSIRKGARPRVAMRSPVANTCACSARRGKPKSESARPSRRALASDGSTRTSRWSPSCARDRGHARQA